MVVDGRRSASVTIFIRFDHRLKSPIFYDAVILLLVVPEVV